MTLTFNLLWATVMIYSQAKDQGQRLIVSKDRVNTDGRKDGRMDWQTDGRTEAIALPDSLMWSVIKVIRVITRNGRNKERIYKLQRTHFSSFISSIAVSVHSEALLTTFIDTNSFPLEQQLRQCIRHLFANSLSSINGDDSTSISFLFETNLALYM